MRDRGLTRITVGPSDRHWLQWVIGVSLVNLWVAVLWLAFSSGPLLLVATDGSLLVYCIVTTWLTWATLRQELQRPDRGTATCRDLWEEHERLRVRAGVATFVLLVLYLGFVTDDHSSMLERAIISAIGVVFGAAYARTTLAATHEVVARRNSR